MQLYEKGSSLITYKTTTEIKIQSVIPMKINQGIQKIKGACC